MALRWKSGRGRHPGSGEQVRSRGFRFGQARTKVRRDTRCGACATAMSIATEANSLASKASAMSARIWQRACLILTGCPRPFRRGSAATDPACGVRHLVSTIVPMARAVGGCIDRRLPAARSHARSARASRPRRTTDQICGRWLMPAKRRAPSSCRHGCRRKEPLRSDHRSGCVRGAVPRRF